MESLFPRILVLHDASPDSQALVKKISSIFEVTCLANQSELIAAVTTTSYEAIFIAACPLLQDTQLALHAAPLLIDIPIILAYAGEKNENPLWSDCFASSLSAEELRGRINAVINVTRRANRRNEQAHFLIKLDDMLRPLVNSEEITLAAASALGQYLSVNRCAYADVEVDQNTFNLTGNYTNGVPSIAGRYRFADFGQECLRLMQVGLPYIVEDSENDTRTSAVIASYRQTHIRAVICVPLMKSGCFVAAMAVHQNTPRRWSNEEVELLLLVANRCLESIERTRLTRELQEKEARYRTLVEILSSVIWHSDPQGNVTEENPSWHTFTGQSFDQYKGWGWRDAIHPEDRELLSQVWKDIAQGNPPSSVVYRLRRHDGQYRDVIARAAPILNLDGSVQEWVGSCTDITESKRDAQILRDTQERLEAALTAGEVATWVWDIENNRLFGDKNLASLFGFDEAPASTPPIEVYTAGVHPEDRERVVKTLRDCIRLGYDTYYVQHRVIRSQGDIRSLVVRGRIERNQDNWALRIAGVALDVTKRVEAEQALKESEARLRQLANTIPQLAWMANADGHVHWYNDRWYEYTGTTPEQMQGWGWKTVVPSEQLPDLLNKWQASLKLGIPYEVTVPMRGANGDLRTFFIRAAPLYNTAGEIVQWFGTNTDITLLQEAEQAIRQSEERLRQGLVAARMAVWRWDLRSGEVEFAANSDEAFGHSWANEREGWEAIYPDDRPALQAALEQALAERSSYAATVRMRRPPSNELVWIDIRGIVECDTSGTPAFIRGVFLDITERKRAEEALREEHRRKDEFLAMLAHELRNPLSPISAAAHLLPLVGMDRDQLLRISDIIAQQVKHMTKLVDDLLDVSRVTRGLVTLQKSPVDLRAVVQGAVEQVTSLVHARGHRLVLRLAPQAMLVDGDQTRLIQVVANLLNNAAKYTQQGGEIVLQLDGTADSVQLRVCDNGIGLPQDLLPFVFDLFVQGERSPDRSQGGLGLGLALVKNMVELHGGTVSARSEGQGKGSEFSIDLPRMEELLQPAATDDHGFLDPGAEPSLPILVVDDNADAAHTLAMLLEMEGHQVWTCHDGHSALALAARHQPQALILDIGLPGMDGNELAHRLRSKPEFSHATLIALTGYGQARDKEASQHAGFDHHLIKPVDTKKLLALLREIKPSKLQTAME